MITILVKENNTCKGREVRSCNMLAKMKYDEAVAVTGCRSFGDVWIFLHRRDSTIERDTSCSLLAVLLFSFICSNTTGILVIGITLAFGVNTSLYALLHYVILTSDFFPNYTSKFYTMWFIRRDLPIAESTKDGCEFIFKLKIS